MTTELEEIYYHCKQFFSDNNITKEVVEDYQMLMETTDPEVMHNFFKELYDLIEYGD